MRYEAETRHKAVWAILVYLALVSGNTVCPPVFVLLGFVSNELIGLLGFIWLSVTTGWFLVILVEARHPDLALYFLISLCYCSVFFLPLFGALHFKNKIAKRRCAAVQVLFIICHAGAHFVLITQYDLPGRIIECIRY